MSYDAAVHAKAIELTRLSLEMTAEAGSGHPTSAASLAHLVVALMYGHMRYDPAQPDHPAADRLVLSEGHACPIIYAAAADLGIAIADRDGRRRPMTREDALRLRELDSPVDGHPNPAEGFPFFPAATGSLGQGLSIAAGLALARRLDGIPSRVYCLIGDGDSREGQVWEALDFIVDHRLVAVCPIFNCNGYGQTGHVSPQQHPEVIAAKLQAGGYAVRLIDGHNPSEIRAALEEHAAATQRPDAQPVAIVARTVKGWGFLRPEQGGYHGKAVTGDELRAALESLEDMARRLAPEGGDGHLRIPPMVAVPARDRARPAEAPSFAEALRRFGEEAVLERGKIATRRAYGIALRALGHADPEVVALDGDVSNSTFAELFAQDDRLRDRFFECRIAEQNMMSAAVGLAVAGKVPFASTFAKFVTRGADQIEMGVITRAPVKLVGSHTGASVAADGPSQMGLNDVAFFRGFTGLRTPQGRPFFYLLNPADGYAAYALTVAMARHEGPCYLRTMRPDVPLLYDEARPFALGGHQVLGEGTDLLLVATGYMVHEARRAVAELGRRGLAATLVDLYSLPFDGDALAALARRSGGRVLTVEDTYGSGFGAAVAEALAERGGPFTVRQMFVRRIPKSGRTPDEVLRSLGLSAEDIVEAASALVGSAAAPR